MSLIGIEASLIERNPNDEMDRKAIMLCHTIGVEGEGNALSNP